MARKNVSFKIILGSSSMARRKILADMGYEFTVMAADIDEKSIRKENAEELVVALAEAKADAIMSRLETTEQLEENIHPTLLITADTIFLAISYLHLLVSRWRCTKELLEKSHQVRKKHANSSKGLSETTSLPAQGYSGGQATVVGSVVVTNLTKGIREGAWERSEVYFHEIPDKVIDSLIEEGIILNVAGGLMLEHPLTLPFVDTVIGTADHVMGLPRSLTEKLIEEAL